MGLPTENDSLQIIFGDSLYAIARVSANPATKQWAGKIEKGRKGLQTLVAARKEASDATVYAEVARDHAFELLETTVFIFEKKVTGTFADAPAKVTTIFPVTATKTFNATPSKRNELLADLAKVPGKPGLHADLKAPAKVLLDAYNGWQSAVAAHELAQDAESEAVDAVTEGKKVLIAAMVDVHGLLRSKFSSDRQQAETYFRKRSKKVSAADKALAKAERATRAAEKAKAVADTKAQKAAAARAKVSGKQE